MSIRDLERKNNIEKYQVSEDEIKYLIEAAESDIKTAKSLLSSDVCWAFNIAYNAVLQVARAFMYSNGYRPCGEAKHVSVVLFLKEMIESEYKSQINRFNQMRRKRNKAVYGILRDTTEYEAKETVKFADAFVGEIVSLIDI